MSFLTVILAAFAPIAFVILLGVLAGRAGIMQPTASTMLSVLVLDFCLPAELFNAMATTSLSALPDWQFFAGIAAGLLGVFLLALALSMTVFHKPLNEGGLQALNASFPNIAFIGIPVVLAVIGKSAVPFAVMAIVLSSLLLPPVALTLLAAGSKEEKGNKGLILLAHSLCLLGGICGWFDAIFCPILCASILGSCACLAFKSTIEKSLHLMWWLWVCGQRPFFALSTYP